MRTTVKLDASRSLVIEPAASGVKLTLRAGLIPVADFIIQDDAAGAVLFAIEQVFEVREAQAGFAVLSDDLCDAYGVSRGSRRCEVVG